MWISNWVSVWVCYWFFWLEEAGWYIAQSLGLEVKIKVRDSWNQLMSWYDDNELPWCHRLKVFLKKKKSHGFMGLNAIKGKHL